MSAPQPHLRLVSSAFGARTSLPLPDGRAPPQRQRPARKPLGQILIDMKAVEPAHLSRALELRSEQDVRLGDILLAHGWVTDSALMSALALQWGARTVDLAREPPDPRLLDQIGADLCLTNAIIPWHQIGTSLIIATARPEDFAPLRSRIMAELPDFHGQIVMALAPERAIHAALIAARQTSLIRQAESRTAASESCRTISAQSGRNRALALIAALSAWGLAEPRLAALALFLWAGLTLVCWNGLKLASLVSMIRMVSAAKRARRSPPTNIIPLSPERSLSRLPLVSVMVPLFREDDIAPRLIERLGRLDYPRELLDILLVYEEDDHQTRAALSRHPLPRWMRLVAVPDGPIRTKPRALNYALNFCRGSIVGVWDAEDEPDPGQLRTVVETFASRGPEVACLQGILDFYNARHNWLTRCFTLEYASWFRVLLPGLARLGLVVPLGGTTLFFRRAALEDLGGWDAHNVTEDADLGIRLARRGYLTEMIDSVTLEEPNSRPLAWIKQRSRWQKGFAITWAVHMRQPRLLWRQLGAKRFIGVQLLTIGSLSQNALAPLFWSLWLPVFGFWHPLQELLPAGALPAVALLFFVTEVLNVTIAVWAARGAGHRHLIPYVFTLHLYFPMAALACYKALWECVTRPFFWDKTLHGVVENTGETQAPALVSPLPILILENPIMAVAAPATSRHTALTLWNHPAPRLFIPLPERPCRPALSAAAFAPDPPAIEFQPSFEGF